MVRESILPQDEFLCPCLYNLGHTRYGAENYDESIYIWGNLLNSQNTAQITEPFFDFSYSSQDQTDHNTEINISYSNTLISDQYFQSFMKYIAHLGTNMETILNEVVIYSLK